MSFAPPISRGGFHYNGDLYVEVGNLNRHRRASVAEITSILRPDLKKSASTTAPKDQVGHWYEAQLIHYGLPPSKDKARAKMRLLEALNGSKLAVPKDVSKLEADLKKEYAAADRKAKAEYKAQMSTQSGREASTSKKRKHSDVINNVNVNISFGPQGDITVDKGPAVQPLPAKKTKLSTPKTSKKNQSDNKGDEQDRPKQTARRSTGGFTVVQGSRKAPRAPGEEDTPRKKQTAPRNGTPVGQSSTTAAHSITPKQPKPKPTARRGAGYVSIGQRSGTGSSPPLKQESSVKMERKVKQEPPTEDLPKLGLLNGYYDIECPTIADEWPACDADSMSLILTLDTPGMWGEYDFGMFSGILHIQERPWVSSQEPIPCRWRGQIKSDEGEMSFGDNCKGAISFLGRGRIQGWLNLYGRCEFYGSRRAGPGNAPRTAASMQEEWNGYNEEEYGAAGRRRWGGW